MATRSTGFVRFRDSSSTMRVGKIICLGRNYSEHAKEMNAPVDEKPVIFLKPPSALVPSGENVVFPRFSREMHHEVEMVLIIGRRGKHVPQAEAMGYVRGYGVGLDMTLRDLQSTAKKQGLPWAVSKGFDTSAPVSELVGGSMVPDPGNLRITLTVNGEMRQDSNTNRMMLTVPAIVSYVSDFFLLEEGDIIFTGTPEGVGPVHPGDILHAELSNIASLTVTIAGEEDRIPEKQE